VSSSPSTAARQARALHVGIAEQGKLLALAVDHRGALRHYREAMALAVSAGEPEVFFRHYMECALESLELAGSLDDVVSYCDRAIAHHAGLALDAERQLLARRDLAHIHQRRGAVLLKLGRREQARVALAEALRLEPQDMRLCTVLLRWVDSRLHCDAARVLAEQRRHGYFSVRAETVERSRAIALDREAFAPGGSGLQEV
jgi:tetratricopeptide (TPR) repeat protein